MTERKQKDNAKNLNNNLPCFVDDFIKTHFFHLLVLDYTIAEAKNKPHEIITTILNKKYGCYKLYLFKYSAAARYVPALQPIIAGILYSFETLMLPSTTLYFSQMLSVSSNTFSTSDTYF